MRIAVDTHVHCYPFHAVDRLLDAAHRHLSTACPEARVYALCFTERTGHHAFAELREGRRPAGAWCAEAGPDPAALWMRREDGRDLLLLAGRQVVTAERLEVLALGTDRTIDDGIPARAALPLIREERALPVLPWGLGKWLGARGALVRKLVEESEPGAFALADTYLLPARLRRPTLLRRAERLGFRVLAGTDPLGRAGEEEMAGRYGVSADAEFDTSEPSTSLIRLLGDPGIPLRIIGRRGRLGETFRRMR